MSQDYPDWTRLFHLVGTDITIPINIEASAVTLDVNLVASAVTIDVNIIAAAVTLPVSIDAATVTLDVNLTAATATIDINFSDQSVAVFDAAKWFAHNAAQVFIMGSVTVDSGHEYVCCTRTVPSGKVMFVTGFGYGERSDTYFTKLILGQMRIDGSVTAVLGSEIGHGITLDTPIRVTAGQIVDLMVWAAGQTGSVSIYGGFWGYDEDA